MPNRDPIFFNHGSNNLVAGPRFEVNARGIIPRDDKLQTSYVEPSDQRAEFYALKRCPRDARGARARSVRNIRPDGYPSVDIDTRCMATILNSVIIK